MAKIKKIVKLISTKINFFKYRTVLWNHSFVHIMKKNIISSNRLLKNARRYNIKDKIWVHVPFIKLDDKENEINLML